MKTRHALMLAGSIFAISSITTGQVVTDPAFGRPRAYAWSNAQIVACGAVLSCDIAMVTLPAKTNVTNAYVAIDTQAGGPATLTVSCGDTGSYVNYILASNAKAAANTLYGDAVGERGTAIDTEWFHVPSYTATTVVKCQFVSTGSNLDAVTTSTGRLILTTIQLP